MRKNTLVYVFLIVASFAFAQNDPILFSVEDDPVHVSEFKYIYEKNNGKEADYSEKSLRDYLDLYVKFKLKVMRAKKMGLDTIPALQAELAGYRKQLANSYLVDKEVANKLIDEAVQRMQEDIEVSHIFIAAEPKSNPERVNAAREQIHSIKMKLESGMDFITAAKVYSEDKASGLKGGNLGYYTAPLPNGFYEFENALYNTKVGEYSDYFRSKMGFHIIKVTDRRPARGEMEVAHILIRKKVNNIPVPDAKDKIIKIHEDLKAGGNFDQLCQMYSDDKKTKNKGGYLGYFGINQFEKSFEDAAFGLEKDGDLSEPVETEIGWHIIKRLAKRDMENIKEMTKRIKSKISKSDRYEIAQKALIEKIKEEAGFKDDKKQLDNFALLLDTEFYSYKWQIPSIEDQFLMSFGTQEYGIMDFANYIKKQTRDRLRFNKLKPVKEALYELYSKYTEDAAVKYEESNLENKYPDFKSLMREYEEGILLFEATKLEVWDKASQDTVGLKNYHEDHRDDYKWKKRAKVASIKINSEDSKLVKKIYKSSQKDDLSELIEKYNSDEEIITYTTNTYENGSPELENIDLDVSEASALIYNNETKTTSYKLVLEVLPEALKTMNEARGYIIADYQDFLEKRWVKGLSSQYEYKLDEEIFESLIK